MLTAEEKRSPLSLVPHDAIFIVETNNFTEGWEKIRKTELWKNLMENSIFEEYNQNIQSVDSFIHQNKTLDLIVSNRKMLASVHMISEVDFDFIFIVDAKHASKVSSFLPMLEMFDYKVSKRNELYKITDNTSDDKYYLTIIDNLVVVSLSEKLVQDLIQQKDEDFWNKNEDYKKTSVEISQNKLINVYINYSQLPKFIKIFATENNELSSYISSAFKYSAFNADIVENMVELEGFSILSNQNNYLKSFSQIVPGKMLCHKILPTNTAMIVSICFDNFLKLYNKIITDFKDDDNIKLYNKRIRQLEKELEIDIEEDFYSWIGEEIALVKTNPRFGNRKEEILIVIHSNEILEAQNKLNHLTKEIGKNAPVKFRSKLYRNYKINFINVKGLFKIIFGKLFESVEKPYYTIVDDFVVFSNSEKTLTDLINSYLKANTLSHNEYFNLFKENFSSKSNLNIFVQTPHIYSQLYQSGNNDFKKKLSENKDLFLSFNLIGLQLTFDDEFMKTLFIANHDKNAMFNLELEELENSAAEELFNLEYENLEFIVEIPEEMKDEYTKLKYPDEIIQHEGKLKNGKPNGLWRSYYENTNIKNAVNYNLGEVNGEAIFYYNSPGSPQKAEVYFENNKIDGSYKEYYKNGNLKAVLNYKKSKPNGEANFFYESGILKIKAQFKNGIRSGKWKYYRENGEVYEKKKWKKGVK